MKAGIFSCSITIAWIAFIALEIEGTINLIATAYQKSFVSHDTFGTSNYPDGNYTRDWLITGNVANYSILITYGQCKMETGNGKGVCLADRVYVYDGENSSYPLLQDTCCGILPAHTSTIRSTGSTMYIIFKTDDTLTEAGFEINYILEGAPTSTLPTTSITEAVSVSEKDDTLIYIIIACVVAGLLIIILILICIICCKKKNKNKPKKKKKKKNIQRPIVVRTESGSLHGVDSDETISPPPAYSAVENELRRQTNTNIEPNQNRSNNNNNEETQVKNINGPSTSGTNDTNITVANSKPDNMQKSTKPVKTTFIKKENEESINNNQTQETTNKHITKDVSQGDNQTNEDADKTEKSVITRGVPNNSKKEEPNERITVVKLNDSLPESQTEENENRPMTSTTVEHVDDAEDKTIKGYGTKQKVQSKQRNDQWKKIDDTTVYGVTNITSFKDTEYEVKYSKNSEDKSKKSKRKLKTNEVVKDITPTKDTEDQSIIDSFYESKRNEDNTANNSVQNGKTHLSNGDDNSVQNEKTHSRNGDDNSVQNGKTHSSNGDDNSVQNGKAHSSNGDERLESKDGKKPENTNTTEISSLKHEVTNHISQSEDGEKQENNVSLSVKENIVQHDTDKSFQQNEIHTKNSNNVIHSTDHEQNGNGASTSVTPRKLKINYSLHRQNDHKLNRESEFASLFIQLKDQEEITSKRNPIDPNVHNGIGQSSISNNPPNNNQQTSPNNDEQNPLNYTKKVEDSSQEQNRMDTDSFQEHDSKDEVSHQEQNIMDKYLDQEQNRMDKDSYEDKGKIGKEENNVFNDEIATISMTVDERTHQLETNSQEIDKHEPKSKIKNDIPISNQKAETFYVPPGTNEIKCNTTKCDESGFSDDTDQLDTESSLVYDRNVKPKAQSINKRHNISDQDQDQTKSNNLKSQRENSNREDNGQRKEAFTISKEDSDYLSLTSAIQKEQSDDISIENSLYEKSSNLSKTGNGQNKNNSNIENKATLRRFYNSNKIHHNDSDSFKTNQNKFKIPNGVIKGKSFSGESSMYSSSDKLSGRYSRSNGKYDETFLDEKHKDRLQELKSIYHSHSNHGQNDKSLIKIRPQSDPIVFKLPINNKVNPWLVQPKHEVSSADSRQVTKATLLRRMRTMGVHEEEDEDIPQLIPKTHAFSILRSRTTLGSDELEESHSRELPPLRGVPKTKLPHLPGAWTPAKVPDIIKKY